MSYLMDTLLADRDRLERRNAAALQSGQDRWESPPEPDEDTVTLDAATDAVIEQIGRACRTFDKAAAIDLLKSAEAMLSDLCDQIKSGEVAL